MNQNNEQAKSGYVTISPDNNVMFIESSAKDAEGIRQEIAGLIGQEEYDASKFQCLKCDNSIFHNAGVGKSIGLEGDMDFLMIFPNEGIPNWIASLIMDKDDAPTSREGYCGVIGTAVIVWAAKDRVNDGFITSPFDEKVCGEVIDGIFGQIVSEMNKNCRTICTHFLKQKNTSLPNLCEAANISTSDYHKWRSGSISLDIDTLNAMCEYMVANGLELRRYY